MEKPVIFNIQICFETKQFEWEVDVDVEAAVRIGITHLMEKKRSARNRVILYHDSLNVLVSNK